MDSIVLTNKKIAANQAIREKEYWKKNLEGDINKIVFPYDFIVKEMINYTNFTFSITGKFFERLLEISNASFVRMHMVLVAECLMLLYKYVKINDIIIGFPIDKVDVEGELTNTVLTLRNFLDGDLTFKDLLFKVKETIDNAIIHQNYPIEQILNDLDLLHSEKNFPLFDIAVLLKNIHDEKYIEYLPLNVLFIFDQKEDSLEVCIRYNSELYKPSTIKRLSQHFNSLLENSLFTVEKKLRSINITSEDDVMIKEEIKSGDFTYSNSIVDTFHKNNSHNQNKVAIIYKDQHLTFKELDKRSTILAHQLINNGVQLNSIVGLILERSIEMIIAIYGVLKTGAAYVPIDHQLPINRVSYMISDSNAELILTQKTVKQNNKELVNLIEKKKHYLIDSINSIDYTSDMKYREVQLNNLAYIIYTSGTTGFPKGVMIEHKNILNFVYGLNENIYRKYNHNLHLALLSSFVFDASVQHIFGATLFGHKMIIVPEEVRPQGKMLLKFYKRNAIDITDGTPTHLSLIADALSNSNVNLDIKQYIIGGEILSKSLVKRIIEQDKTNNVTVTNVYGPTECTVNCSSIDITSKNIEQYDTIPIGDSMQNYSIYILDKYKNKQSVGISGDIFISGLSVARGYLNKVEQTFDKFDINPFNKEERIYNTGDRGKRKLDSFYFIGRSDNQIKLRGYRIELGEIEKAILRIGLIISATVISFKANDDILLCAYYVSDKKITTKELRNFLANEIPDYMVPSYLIQINEMPLTANGKIDKNKLPKPELVIEDEYVSPRNDIEKKLTEIWSTVLDLEQSKIGITSNFFELGGHSLKVILLISRINKELNVNIPITEIFEHPTIAELAEEIQQSDINTTVKYIKKVEKKSFYKLSSSQQRIYIHQQLNPKSTAYNISLLIKLTGNLNVKKLQDCINVLVKRYESLRTTFKEINGEAVQIIHEPFITNFNFLLSDGNDIEKLTKNNIEEFCLSQLPLFKVSLIKIKDNEHVFMLEMHHIISDGLSMNLFFTDIVRLYNNQKLTAEPIQYKDFSEYQYRNYKEIIEKQEEFWLDHLKGELFPLQLPSDFERPEIKNFEGDRVYFDINESELYKLKKISDEHKTTLFSLMISAFYVYLFKLTNQNDIAIGIPVAGRTHADIHNSFGLFVNTITLRNKVDENKSFNDFYLKVNENVKICLNNQDYPFDLLVRKIVKERDTSRNPIFDVMFVFDSYNDSQYNIADLEIETIKLDRKDSKFDLTLHVVEQIDKISCSFQYSTQLFNRETIENYANIFTEIINQIVNDKSILINKLNVNNNSSMDKIYNPEIDFSF